MQCAPPLAYRPEEGGVFGPQRPSSGWLTHRPAQSGAPAIFHVVLKSMRGPHRWGRTIHPPERRSSCSRARWPGVAGPSCGRGRGRAAGWAGRAPLPRARLQGCWGRASRGAQGPWEPALGALQAPPCSLPTAQPTAPSLLPVPRWPPVTNCPLSPCISPPQGDPGGRRSSCNDLCEP